MGFWRVRARKLTGEVVYQPGAFTIGHGDAAHLISPHRDDLEVIGNIYEHPKLIEREAELALDMYIRGFQANQMGAASVIGVILVVVGLVLTVVIQRMAGRDLRPSQMEGM